MATVNGSLWTLAPQFTLYLLIIPLFFIRKSRQMVVGLTVAALALILAKNIVFADKFAHTEILMLNVGLFMPFAQYFVTGILLQTRTSCRTNKARWIAIAVCVCACVMLMIINANVHVPIALKPLEMLCVSVMFLMVGEMCWQPVSDVFRRVGDLSYGVYIYSFPIQQMVIASIPGIAPRTIMALTIVIVLPVAFVSWRIIEKPALSMKKYL
jgi:peptidoglycan/LPS O-acetylase OafA/YrhL